MTEKKSQAMANVVKLFDDAMLKFKEVPALHRELIRLGISISSTALYDVVNGKQRSVKPDMIVALCHLVYDGDWKKAGKALEADFMPKKGS